MLVILTEDQVLSTDMVCKNCLLADKTGHPRWKHGSLGCGKTRRSSDQGRQSQNSSPNEYQCQMGFRLTQVQ